MSAVDVPSVGDLLAERYRLEEHLGGANGHRQLWRGVDVLLHRSVAVVLRSPGGDEAAPTMTAAVAASRAHVDSMVDVYDATGERTLLKLEGIERRAGPSSEFDVAVDIDRSAVPAQLGRLSWKWH